MKRALYLYISLLWSLVQVFLFGCLIAVIDEYFISNNAAKDQGDIVALIMMIMIVIVGALIDAAIRKCNEWYMMLLGVIVSPIRFIFQIVTIVKFHQSKNREKFAPRGGYYTGNLRDWAMYVLFSTISLSEGRQYKKAPKYTGPTVELDYEKRYRTKTRSTDPRSGYTPPRTPDVYSDEYQSKFWTCKDCKYFTTYKKEVDGFFITSVTQGWCTRSGTSTHEGSKCFDFVKKR